MPDVPELSRLLIWHVCVVDLVFVFANSQNTIIESSTTKLFAKVGDLAALQTTPACIFLQIAYG